jgi:SAM-dependent methyltransferase
MRRIYEVVSPRAPDAVPIAGWAKIAREQPYDTDYYEKQAEGSSRSASAVVPMLLQFVPAKSVVDVGCGTGTWLAAFRENGVPRILGIDGEWVAPEKLRISPDCFIVLDLRTPIEIEERFDLAVSLEVAEHLPEEAGETLVDSLTRLSSVVAFSAAVPGQGGRDHLNERCPDHWERLFARRGYCVIDCARPQLWNDSRVECWYRQNLLLFASADALSHSKTLRDESMRRRGPLSIAHPELIQRMEARRERLRERVSEPPLRNFPSAVHKKVRRRIRRRFEAIGNDPRRVSD